MSEQAKKKLLSKQRKAQKKAAQKQQQTHSGQDRDAAKKGYYVEVASAFRNDGILRGE